MSNVEQSDIENLIKILDGFCDAEESRMKLNVTEKISPGKTEHRYHHGRCDVGSPWAKGEAFDVLE